MSISEQVKELRQYASEHNLPPFGREIAGTSGLLKKAADTIEALSKKLENMERSEDSYNEKTVTLPCDLGDTVYRIVPKTYKKIIELQVESFIFGEKGLLFKTEKAHLVHSCEEFGKTVFLTKEEAVIASKEMRNEP